MLGPLEDKPSSTITFLNMYGNYSTTKEPSNKYPETTWI
jgi:hypothetical protein